MYKRYKLENNSDLETLVREYSSYGEEIMKSKKVI